LDGDPLNFSTPAPVPDGTSEVEQITAIWKRVSEDYAPFDIDVTTVDPGIEALRKAGSGRTVPSTDVGQVIDGSGQISSMLDFSGATSPITDIEIQLDITHSAVGDLSLVLVSPSGTTVNLLTNVGGSGHNFLNTILDDQATIKIDDPSAVAPYTGSYQPQ